VYSMLRYVLIPFLVWAGIAFGYVAVVSAFYYRHNSLPEGWYFYEAAVSLGIAVVLLCWPVCRAFRVFAATLTAVAIGFVLPLVVARICFAFPPTTNMSSLELALPFVVLSIPSGIGAAAVACLQSRFRRASGGVEG
jgi:hypothetical protein